MPLPAQRPFFGGEMPKFEQKFISTVRERLKSSYIFTLSSERWHYFQHLRSR